uniref:Uncharacterized protein n=1 Tax=Arundo donax TaxID=35708 RepID=A0A0A8YCT6_ARUDO
MNWSKKIQYTLPRSKRSEVLHAIKFSFAQVPEYCPVYTYYQSVLFKPHIL